MPLDPALLIGRPVYACSRGHESHEPGICRATLRRGLKIWPCNLSTSIARHDPSPLVIALAGRDALLEEYAAADSAGRMTIEPRLQRAEQRLVEAAIDAGLSWDEARKL